METVKFINNRNPQVALMALAVCSSPEISTDASFSKHLSSVVAILCIFKSQPKTSSTSWYGASQNVHL